MSNLTLTVARAFFLRGLQEALSYRAMLGMRLVWAAMTLLTFFYLARFIDLGRSPQLAQYGVGYLGFGLVGMVLINLQYTAVSAYPESVREAQLNGTLEAVLAAPVPSWLVLLCSPVYRFASSFLWATAYLLAGGLLFGVRFGPVCWTSLLLGLPLCVVAFTSLGFLAAAFTMVLRRGDPISLALGGVSALLGGAFYPTAVLPPWMQALGRALPITHALELVRRAVFTAASPVELGSELLDLAAFCAVMAPLGLLAVTRAVRRARRDGSLTHY